ncbi:MAG: M3 family peptidase, partial [Nannocystaceae bacterium]
MRTKITTLAAITLLSLGSCTKTTEGETNPPSQAVSDNALLAEWTGPYGGVPAFDRMDLALLEPAMVEGMQLHLAELDAIAADPKPPTFDNTIVAMERAGEAFRRVEVYQGIWSSNLSTPEFRQVQERLAQLESEYRSKIVQNEALFARVEAVYESPELTSRSPAEQRLVKLSYDRFARRGATLRGEAKTRYAAIEARLAELQTMFGNNVLADEEGIVHIL